MTKEIIESHNIDGVMYQKVKFFGLSSETRPTTVNGFPLYDGSSFFCIDTSDVYMWAMGDSTWHKLGGE